MAMKNKIRYRIWAFFINRHLNTENGILDKIYSTIALWLLYHGARKRVTEDLLDPPS